MLVVMEQNASDAQINAVVRCIEEKGYAARPIPGGHRVAIGIVNNEGPVESAVFMALPGVKDVVPVTRPYKQVSREFKPDDTLIEVRDTVIGNGYFTLIAGP